MPIEYRISICDVDGTENPHGFHYKIKEVVPKTDGGFTYAGRERILRRGTWQWNIIHWMVTADTNDVNKLLEICYFGA